MNKINRGMFGGAIPNYQSDQGGFGGQQQPTQSPTQQGQKPNWIGILADALSGFAGGPANFANQQYEQRQYQQQLQAQQQRDAANQDAAWQKFVAEQEYKSAHQAPSSFEHLLDAAGYQGDERTKLLQRKAQNDANGVPVAIDVTNPDGSVSRQYVSPGSLGGGQSAPQRPVGKLTPYNGGPTASQSGGFR